MKHVYCLLAVWLAGIALIACGGGGGGNGGNSTETQPTPEATQAAPQGDAALAAVGQFVATQQKEYTGDCATAPATDPAKLCSTAKGERSSLRAYQLLQPNNQPVFWLVVQQAGQTWTVASSTPITQGNASTPGVPWPLAIGAEVVIVGVAPDPCLNVRDAPGLSAKAVDCVKDGTRIKLFAGPQVVDNIAWWQIEGRTGWVSGDFLRYPDAAQ